MPVMCRECGIRPSKIHYTEIVNNSMVTMDLCVECAEERGIDVHKAGGYGLGDLFAGLMENATPAEAEKITRVKCPRCGYEYSQFKKMGRLGCPDCYEAFEGQLMPLLRQLHGSTQHQGKSPKALGPRAVMRKELMKLKEELSKAVADEEYETAAKIRDQINALEAKVEDR
jgi:protein arginine kinase activator